MKMANIIVNRVAISDINQLQQISSQTFHETFSAMNTELNMKKYLEEEFSTEKLSDELLNNDSEFYFALLENNVIGYLKLNFGKSQTELQDDNALELERIYVLKEFQGKSVGQLLYDQAVQIARQRNVDYLWLGVWENNLRARNFYQKNGLVEFSKHIFKLGNDEQTDIMMKLMLDWYEIEHLTMYN
jgi:ribosomal protein S18 acetylase RimI-like enzyme